MDIKTGRLRQWGMVFCGISLGIAGTGCSTTIAYSGISGPHELHAPVTRTEVRERFGDPTSVEARADEVTVETHHIRRPTPSAVNAFGRDFQSFLLTYGLAEVITTPVVLYHSEKAKLRVAFVYGADDRVLCHYHVNSPVALRYDDATLPLAASLWKSLEGGACPSWASCITSFVEQVRRRAACVGHTLSSADEANLERLLAIAENADKSALGKEVALKEVERTGLLP